MIFNWFDQLININPFVSVFNFKSTQKKTTENHSIISLYYIKWLFYFIIYNFLSMCRSSWVFFCFLVKKTSIINSFHFLWYLCEYKMRKISCNQNVFFLKNISPSIKKTLVLHGEWSICWINFAKKKQCVFLRIQRLFRDIFTTSVYELNWCFEDVPVTIDCLYNFRIIIIRLYRFRHTLVEKSISVCDSIMALLWHMWCLV